MRSIFKKTRVLILGSALPIILLLAFYLTTVLPKMLVAPPQNDFVYLTTFHPREIRTEIKNGQLKVWATTATQGAKTWLDPNPELQQVNRPLPKLFWFNVKTQTAIEIPATLSTTVPETAVVIKLDTLATQKELVIPALTDLKLDPEERSPDGYKAENTLEDNYKGFIGFFIHTLLQPKERAGGLTISKYGNVFRIATPEFTSEYGSQSIKFLGWILPQ